MDLLSLQQAMIKQGPVDLPVQADFTTPSSSDAATAEQLWSALDQSYSSIASFRNSSLDRWHRKSMLGGGAALKGNLQTLNQSVSSQASIALFHAPRVMKVP